MPGPAFEAIVPRELKPALLELDGISRESVEAHYKLYEGYVNKRNEILRELGGGRPRSGEPGLLAAARAQGRADASRSAGSRTTSSTSSTSAETAATRTARSASSSSATSARRTEWRADLKATGLAARGWAWTAYDWDEARLFNYIGDAQNTYPIWNATPLVALDVYEHAYFLDYRTDRASYIDRFFDNLDWTTVNDWVSSYQIPLK